jgi:hypothetical protein
MIDIKEFQNVIEKAKELALKKNADYGDSGLLLFKAQGILIRMNDKLGRLNYFFENRTKDLNYESIDDNIIDLINYSVYLHMYLNGKLIKK